MRESGQHGIRAITHLLCLLLDLIPKSCRDSWIIAQSPGNSGVTDVHLARDLADGYSRLGAGGFHRDLESTFRAQVASQLCNLVHVALIVTSGRRRHGSKVKLYRQIEMPGLVLSL
jgi:hypothetical protein